MKSNYRQLTRGLTLLELLLALSLSVIILAVVGMAIELQLRTLESRRTYLEEAQIARAVLRMIAADLRTAVSNEPQDFSAIELMLTQPGSSPPVQPSGSAPPVQPSGSAPPVQPPGLYGNTFELQVDVSRLPRLDELRYQSGPPVAAAGVISSQIPSDVRTVTWYVQGGTLTAPLGAAATAGATTGAMSGTMASGAGMAAPVVDDFGEITPGLVRREMGRAVSQWAISSGQTQQLQGLGELLAPEVTGLQFLYFDGLQWYPEWDSDQMGGLPLAVEITLFMQPPDSVLDDQGQVVLDPALSAQTSAGVVEGQLEYRLVVRLPNALPAPPPPPIP